MAKYVLAVDQSTQGTKALILDEAGGILARADLPHRQIINDAGWVSHDPEEIYGNTLKVVRMAAEKAGIDPADIVCMGISNQSPESPSATPSYGSAPGLRTSARRSGKPASVRPCGSAPASLFPPISRRPGWAGFCRMCRKPELWRKNTGCAWEPWTAGWYGN